MLCLVINFFILNLSAIATENGQIRKWASEILYVFIYYYLYDRWFLFLELFLTCCVLEQIFGFPRDFLRSKLVYWVQNGRNESHCSLSPARRDAIDIDYNSSIESCHANITILTIIKSKNIKTQYWSEHKTLGSCPKSP